MQNETIEQLRKRYETLNTRKITADANLASAARELARIQEEARTQWGTDDLVALEKKLEHMRQENEKNRAAYQQHLEEIEQKVAVVEKQFKQS